jgi:class 3 adenylate cyclase/tetratricopeptide (TPR) repeat protein
VPTCGRCGQESPAGFSFCGGCGAKFVDDGLGAARKTVTVLFADVCGSTTLGERLDAESVRRVMWSYFDAMQVCLERYGGTVEKFIGDAVMGVFGIPVLHEDDALRALRAAVEMRDRLVSLNDEFAHKFGIHVEQRIGVNTGEVVAGDSPSGQRLATGDAVNVAARLEQAAQAGEILIGETTAALARGVAAVERLEPIPARGKAEAVPVFRLVRALEDGGPADAPQPRFVGRTSELAALRSVFEEVLEKKVCRLVTILGPAGIGKSRLSDEFVSTLPIEVCIVGGRCLPYGEGVTYWPLREMVNQFAGSTTAEDALTALLAEEEHGELAIQRILSAVGVLPVLASSAEIQWAVCLLLAALARERPLVVTLEDVHWADGVFLDVVEYLGRFSSEASILIVCSARNELLEARPSWAHASADCLLQLAPLPEAEALLLLAGTDDSKSLEPEVESRIVQRAEGNPLFIQQLRALQAEDGARDELPATIQALLAARIDRLGRSERTVLERAAIEGRTFHRGAVFDLLPDSDRDLLGTRLMQLLRKDFIAPDTPVFRDDDGFRFSHLLVRDAVYAQMPKELRARLHVDFANWLERRACGQLAEYDEIVGYHLERAYRYRLELALIDRNAQDLAARAGVCFAAAGRRAYARGDPSVCVRLLTRAAELLPDDDATRLHALPELAFALMSEGDLARAETVLREAAGRAEKAGDPLLEAHARLLLPWLGFQMGSGASIEELLEPIGRIRRTFASEDDQIGLARAWRLTGVIEAMAGRLGNAADAFEDAFRAAEACGEVREASQALRSLCETMLMGPTPVEEAIERCEQILQGDIAGQPARTTAIPERSTAGATLRTTLANLYATRGRFGEARRLCTEAIATLNELDTRWDLAVLSLQTSAVDILADDPAGAETILQESYELLYQMGDRAYLSTVAAYLADALCKQHRDREAGRYARISKEAASEGDSLTQVVWRAVSATVAARRGEYEAAERLAREAVRRADATDMLDLQADSRVALVEVLLLAGDNEGARLSTEAAIELYDRKGNIVSAAKARQQSGGLAQPSARS